MLYATSTIDPISRALKSHSNKVRRRTIRDLPRLLEVLKYFDPEEAERLKAAYERKAANDKDQAEVQSGDNNVIQNTSSHQQSQSHSGTGKPIKLALPIIQVGSAPEIDDVFCDGIGLTWAEGYSERQQAILKRIDDLQKKHHGQLHLKKVFIPKSHYRTNVSIMFGDDNLGLLQAQPHEKYRAFHCFTCNPGRIGVEAFWQAIAAVAYALWMTPQELIATAYVSYMDVAIDIKNEVVGNLTVRPSRAAYSGIALRFFKDGKLIRTDIGTFYGGQNRSPIFSRTYDKRADLKKKGTVVGFDLTRDEKRIRPRITVPGPGGKTVSRCCHLDEIRQLGNPLKRFVVARFPEQINQDLSLHLLLVLSRWIGITAALKHVHDRAALERFRRHIKKGVVAWWQPDELWQQFLAYFDQLFANPEQAIDAGKVVRRHRRL